MMLKKSFSIMLASIVLTSAYSAVQTTPVPTKPAKTTEATLDWPAVMKDLAQNNPALHEKIKTGAPLFFEWATRTKWQRRGRNALTMIAVPALMHELFVQLISRSPLDKSDTLPKLGKTQGVIAPLIRPFLMHTPSFLYNHLRTSGLPITLKEIVKIRLITSLILTLAAAASKAAGRTFPKTPTADYLDELKYENPTFYNLASTVLPKNINGLADMLVLSAGTLSAEVISFFLIRHLLKKKQVKLKEQEAQVTQWLNAAGITLNKGTSDDA